MEKHEMRELEAGMHALAALEQKTGAQPACGLEAVF